MMLVSIQVRRVLFLTLKERRVSLKLILIVPSFCGHASFCNSG